MNLINKFNNIINIITYFIIIYALLLNDIVKIVEIDEFKKQNKTKLVRFG